MPRKRSRQIALAEKTAKMRRKNAEINALKIVNHAGDSVVTGRTETDNDDVGAWMRVVYGSFHQASSGNISEVSKGKMCTACALIAICVGTHVSPGEWTSQTVDTVLTVGDQFYRISIETRRMYAPHVNHPYLTADEVTHHSNNTFSIVDFDVFRCTEQLELAVFGYLRQTGGEMLPLAEGLLRFFDRANFGLLICASQTMALLKVRGPDNTVEYCIFDSHSRDTFSSATNNAFYMRCKSVQKLTESLLDIHRLQPNSSMYAIHAIAIENSSHRVLRVPSSRYIFAIGGPTVHPSNQPPRRRGPRRKSAPINEVGTSARKMASDDESSYLGEMNIVCEYCNALKFRSETAFSCCKKGQVQLPILGNYPDFFEALLSGDHPNSKEFVKNVRAYNSNIAMASVSANYDVPPGRGASIVKISGVFHHRIADVSRENPRFGSVYICAGTNDTSCDNPDLNISLLAELRRTLRGINKFVRLYRQMGELIDRADQQPIEEMYINFYLHPTTDRRRYNAPTDPNEIGVVFSSRDGQVPANDGEKNGLRVYYRDVARRQNNYGMRYVSTTSAISDPLCYPLLFPNGELGWCVKMALSSLAPPGRKRLRISMREFYVFRLQIRPNVFNPILSAGKLTQQFVVDSYVKIEKDRLIFHRANQKKLRVHSYAGLMDTIKRAHDNEGGVDVGRIIILPATFQGGLRHMVGNYQDSMTMVAKFGKPTFFITMTCNCGWREIKENLLRYQSPSDRPDLIVRVFHQKLKLLMRDLTEKAIFGKIIAWVYVIEFQKRGLPHAHISITIDECQAPRTAEDVDIIISAELPNKIHSPDLHQAVLDLMVHGPCGVLNPNSPCMEEGKCKKKYPFSFVEKTEMRAGFITYRRRQFDDVSVVKKRSVDNRWIIPYNPYLLLKYRSHINVLYVANVGCVKYLYKYITKGHDAALYRVQNQRTNPDGDMIVYDEITEYIQSRYVSACEAAWRTFKMFMVDKSHTVVRLQVHLPNQRSVYFGENDDIGDVLDRADMETSLLEAYFQLNGIDEFARTLHYIDIPEHYAFRNKTWQRRQRKCKTIGRIYSINPRQVEQFHLRVLLLHVKGATSFEDLLNPHDDDPTPCTSFREAARRRLLIGGDDLEWERTLEEYSKMQVAGQLRKMFCYLLTFCEINQPRILYERFKGYLLEDYQRRGMSEYESERWCLLRMEHFMNGMSASLVGHGFADLLARFDVSKEALNATTIQQQQHQNQADPCENDLEIEALQVTDLMVGVENDIRVLNQQQRMVLDLLWEATTQQGQSTENSKCFYLQGAGGTGKTYLYNVLLKLSEAAGIPSCAVAYTGIAALLLRNGRTAHSAFKLPLDMHETSSSAIVNGSYEAERLKRVKLLVWDEISMTSHFTIDVVDRLLRQLHGRQSVPFGGVCVLLGGDLRQLLPVNRGNTAQMEDTFMNCTAWPHFRVVELTENMRVDRDARRFASWLIKLGDGTLGTPSPLRELLPPGSVEVPRECVSTDVVRDIYGDIFEMSENDRFTALSERMVLCSLNRTCDAINDQMIDRFLGDVFISFSVDGIETDNPDDRIKYQEEVLNSRDHSGMPKHELRLKVGVPIILLRNISMEDGLVNGTRMIVKSITRYILTAEIVSGPRRGEIHSLPRMDLTSRDPHFPFTLKRRQFPVRACFAMTINKSQGQTFKRVGICLPLPVFAYGQLYVAFSRTVNFASVRVQIEKTTVQGRLLPGDQRVFTRNLAPVELLKRLRQQQQLPWSGD